MNQQEWQSYFDEQFPDGLNVTQIEDVEEGNDNTNFVSPRITVTAVEDDEPTVVLFPLGVQTKDVRFRVQRLEPRPDGFLVETPETDDPNFVLTRNFSPQVGKALKAERNRLIAQEKKYAD